MRFINEGIRNLTQVAAGPHQDQLGICLRVHLVGPVLVGFLPAGSVEGSPEGRELHLPSLPVLLCAFDGAGAQRAQASACWRGVS